MNIFSLIGRLGRMGKANADAPGRKGKRNPARLQS